MFAAGLVLASGTLTSAQESSTERWMSARAYLALEDGPRRYYLLGVWEALSIYLACPTKLTYR